MLINYKRGNYSFLRGISPYSAGAVAENGYEIEHARLARAIPLRAGFDAIAAHLSALGRPKQALCGIELRSPQPFSFQGFADFNASYVDILRSWDILQDRLNPVARTNVAPEIDPPAEVMLYGFSYTAPAKDAPRTFVIAGAGELPEGSLDPHDIVRRGEASPEALREKARFVLGLMDTRLHGLGAAWQQVTATGIYTVHSICPMLARDILPALGPANKHGVTWHHARPPVAGIEYEMDLRGCRKEIIVH